VRLCINLIERKNIASPINEPSADALRIKVKDMDAVADYSCSVSEKMNSSCINTIFNIFSFYQILSFIFTSYLHLIFRFLVSSKKILPANSCFFYVFTSFSFLPFCYITKKLNLSILFRFEEYLIATERQKRQVF